MVITFLVLKVIVEHFLFSISEKLSGIFTVICKKILILHSILYSLQYCLLIIAFN